MCDVLVVEDWPIVRMVLVEMLEDEGFKVREASNLAQALAIAGGPAGCSVLVTDLDLGLPDLDGFGMAALVQSVVPGLPVLFVSGRQWRLEAHACTANQRTLCKPFTKDKLVALVRELLPNRAGLLASC